MQNSVRDGNEKQNSIYLQALRRRRHANNLPEACVSFEYKSAWMPGRPTTMDTISYAARPPPTDYPPLRRAYFSLSSFAGVDRERQRHRGASIRVNTVWGRMADLVSFALMAWWIKVVMSVWLSPAWVNLAR